MTDHELEQSLRAWYRAEVGDEAAPTTLRDSLADVTEVAPAGLAVDRRTLLLLAAAAMLTVAAIGSALAIGSGLVRPPWLEDSSLLPIYGAGWCEPALADELVLTFEADERPTLTDLPRYFVYQDGRVLRLDPSATSFDSPVPPSERKGWTQRNLTAEGLQHLVESAREIGGTGCEAIYIGDTGYQEYNLRTRTDAGVTQVVFGTGLFQTGASDTDAMAAAVDLAGRFADPDLGLGSSDWADPDWLAWVPERYIVTASLDAGTVPVANQPGEGIVDPFNPLWDVTLPDGSTLQTFGVTVSGIEDAGLLIWRCGIVGVEEATAIVAALDEAYLVRTFDLPGVGSRFDLPGVASGLDLSGGGALSVEAALPHQVDCLDFTSRVFSVTPPLPQDVAAETPEPGVADRSACDLVDGERFWSDEPDVWANGWAFCSQVSSFDQVYSRMRATSAAQALELVRREFGEDGYLSDSIAGRTVYLNECVHSSIPCAPAMAISAEPYFVVIRAEQTDPPTDREARLRELAALVIRNLEN